MGHDRTATNVSDDSGNLRISLNQRQSQTMYLTRQQFQLYLLVKGPLQLLNQHNLLERTKIRSLKNKLV